MLEEIERLCNIKLAEFTLHSGLHENAAGVHVFFHFELTVGDSKYPSPRFFDLPECLQSLLDGLRKAAAPKWGT